MSGAHMHLEHWAEVGAGTTLLIETELPPENEDFSQLPLQPRAGVREQGLWDMAVNDYTDALENCRKKRTAFFGPDPPLPRNRRY